MRIVASNWKQPKCPSNEEWINRDLSVQWISIQQQRGGNKHDCFSNYYIKKKTYTRVYTLYEVHEQVKKLIFNDKEQELPLEAEVMAWEGLRGNF